MNHYLGEGSVDILKSYKPQVLPVLRRSYSLPPQTSPQKTDNSDDKSIKPDAVLSSPDMLNVLDDTTRRLNDKITPTKSFETGNLKLSASDCSNIIVQLHETIYVPISSESDAQMIEAKLTSRVEEVLQVLSLLERNERESVSSMLEDFLISARNSLQSRSFMAIVRRLLSTTNSWLKTLSLYEEEPKHNLVATKRLKHK